MKEYKPLPHYVTIRESEVSPDSFGIYTTRDIIANTIIGVTHHTIDYNDFEGNHTSEIIRTPLGGFCQVFERHNCTHVLENGVGKLVTLRAILSGEELSSDFG